MDEVMINGGYDLYKKKNAAKDRKRAKYGDRSLKKAFR